MDDIHLSRELLRAVHDRKVPGNILEEIKTEHLLSRCPHCRAEVQAYEAEVRRRVPLFSRVLQVVLAKLKPLLHPASREQARAERDLRDLLERTPEDRVGVVARARSRFRQPALVRLLLEESRKRAPGDPAEAYLLWP
ncbi:MAG TPA: hypothetical protein DD490_11100 [Acidobacteria bacterium]|nr:hypothetical protein [Acidobacteriota bacterium]